MGRRNRKKPFYEKVEITDIGAEGKSIAKVNDIVVFTSYVIPGDIVDLQVTRKKKRYQEARVNKIHTYSKDRVDAFCEHFGICGGCKWQFLPYVKQLYYKQKQVAGQLSRISKVELPPVSPIIGSEKDTFYRNKLEFTFSNDRWLLDKEVNSESEGIEKRALGFHVPGMFSKVVTINKCWLQPSPSNEVRNFIYKYAATNNLDFFDIKNQEGFLRTIIIRTTSVGEVMLIVTFYKEGKQPREALLRAIKNEFPQITSLLYVINGKGNDTITDQEVKVFSGAAHIWEEMEGLRFKIGPKSFFQTNSTQAYELYKVTRSFAGLSGNEVVYDLYTGTGTIANFIARHAKKVVGVEYVPEAIEDAKINSAANNINNTSFFAGDIKDILNPDFFAKQGSPDVVITDPPRAGMHAGVINTILDALPEKIVYVSCNPSTQARDIALLDEKYSVRKIQPVDMFPHTHHVENVVLLEKK
ncbi:RNA methyltransferase, TrmA family [hydrothermal vent metagenome]|uniref:RNA methyltransferase, TrmA family n=1 Tax=hydrothermal vent metagenome TaxID=652676 RepID=A0A3B0TS17_9ZZZZ